MSLGYTVSWLCPKLKDQHATKSPNKVEEWEQKWRQRKATALVTAQLESPNSSSYQPQNCVPDVIIWMLAGNKRVAVKRIPSHLLMYSKTAKARGKLCGKVQTIFLMVRHYVGTQAVSKLYFSVYFFSHAQELILYAI